LLGATDRSAGVAVARRDVAIREHDSDVMVVIGTASA
jgi:hypothetical protein